MTATTEAPQHDHEADHNCTEGCPVFDATKRPESASRPRRRQKSAKARASGKQAATEEGEKEADDATGEPAKVDMPEETEQWFRAPGFQRMKTAWEGDDAMQMQRVQGVIDKVLFETFPDAYAVMSDLYDIVREPEIEHNTQTGEVVVDPETQQPKVKVDPYGFTVFRRNPLTGAYYEDWSLLSTRQREDFLFRITTSLFDWEQRSADLWTRAMFSKGMFVEKFAIEYDLPIHGTIDDRTARGNVEASEDRYFALMNSAISRKAESLVRTMTNLQLRLKDVLGQA